MSKNSRLFAYFSFPPFHFVGFDGMATDDRKYQNIFYIAKMKTIIAQLYTDLVLYKFWLVSFLMLGYKES